MAKGHFTFSDPMYGPKIAGIDYNEMKYCKQTCEHRTTYFYEYLLDQDDHCKKDTCSLYSN